MTKEMKMVAVGNVVLDERNETLWVVEKKEGKFKTVMVHNRINKDEVVTVTYATFKKHFTVLADVAALTATAEPEAVEEPKAEKKERKARTYKVDPDRDVFIGAVVDMDADTSEFHIHRWEKMPNLIAIRHGKKTVAEVYFGKKVYRLNIKAEVAEELGFTYDLIHNYYLPAAIKKIPYTNPDILDKFLEYLVG